MRRLAQLQWIRRYLGEVESDMSVFHRIDDIRAMPGRRLFTLASLLGAYQGAVHARAAMEARGQDEPPSSRAVPTAGPSPAPRQGPRRISVTERDNLPATAAIVASDPTLAGIFSFGPLKG